MNEVYEEILKMLRHNVTGINSDCLDKITTAIMSYSPEKLVSETIPHLGKHDTHVVSVIYLAYRGSFLDGIRYNINDMFGLMSLAFLEKFAQSAIRGTIKPDDFFNWVDTTDKCPPEMFIYTPLVFFTENKIGNTLFRQFCRKTPMQYLPNHLSIISINHNIRINIDRLDWKIEALKSGNEKIGRVLELEQEIWIEI